MAKQYKIRWTAKDTAELSKSIKRFNAKLTRISKKAPSISYLLPEKVSEKELKDLISTRADLKREINALNRFSKRGAEELVKAPKTTNNVYVTKWQKEELSRRVALVNRKRKARLKEFESLPAKSRGQELGYTVGQKRAYIGMGRAEEVSLLPMIVFAPSMSPSEIRMKYKSAREQSKSSYFTEKDYRCKENFLKGIRENYNYEDVKDVIARIEAMDIREFLRVFYEEGATFEFASPDGMSDAKRFEYEGYLDGLKSGWLPGYVSVLEEVGSISE